MIVGGGGWGGMELGARRPSPRHRRWRSPVLPLPGRWNNSSSSYAGHLTTATEPALAQRLREADVLLVVGDPLGDD